MSGISVNEIEKVLDEKVRPELALHGGDIKIERLEGTVLHVRLIGQCSGCQSADLTMQNLVESELRKALPELQKVELVTGVSDELLAEARMFLQRRHQK